MLPEERKWAAIAHDLVMMTTPAPGATPYTTADIIKAHSLTAEDFKALMGLQSFQNLIKAELIRIKSMGPHAGARLRAEAMSVALQENLFNKAMQNELADELVVKLLGMLLKSAGLEQPPEVVKAQAASQGNTVNIAFNIPKMNNPKLKHLINQPQVNVVDAED